MTKTSRRLREGLSPGKLNQQLELGITDTGPLFGGGRRQFYGMVSNVQFHVFSQKTSQLSTLTKNPCSNKGSLFAWSDMTFSSFGLGVVQTEEDEDKVCDVLPAFYNIFLPAKTQWTDANHICEVLAGGMMTGVESSQEMKRLAKSIKGVSGSCLHSWLPISDAKLEGVWENTNTNSPATFLPWIEGQPNGGRHENYVTLETENFEIRDAPHEEFHCYSCTLKTNATLTLRGVCKDSLLGNYIWEYAK